MKAEQHIAPSGQTFNSIKEVEAHLKTRMEKAISDLQHEMASIRTGRASLSILDHIRVDYFGTPTPLNQLGNLHVPEPSLITVQPWEVSQIGAIEKSIRAGNLGLNPSNDGKLIRIPIPPLNEERRKELVKQLHKKVEEGRVEVRTLRRHSHDELKSKEKSSGVTADEVKRIEAQLQKLTDRYILVCDEIGHAKEKEILAV